MGEQQVQKVKNLVNSSPIHELHKYVHVVWWVKIQS